MSRSAVSTTCNAQLGSAVEFRGLVTNCSYNESRVSINDELVEALACALESTASSNDIKARDPRTITMTPDLESCAAHGSSEKNQMLPAQRSMSQLLRSTEIVNQQHQLNTYRS
ncbi:hypothetical protein BASA61_008447 [Batrachochytrium salamandrivorans]|nr:hypothetical protein BASA61_008447 [Batrachochytrium salamandrivorans]